MYVNKCSKCGSEFETKNPKRVICPDCLYPDRSPGKAPSTILKKTPQQDYDQQDSGYQRRQTVETGEVEDFRRPQSSQRSDYGRPQGGRPYGGGGSSGGRPQGGRSYGGGGQQGGRSYGGGGRPQGNRPYGSSGSGGRPQGGRPYGGGQQGGRPYGGGGGRPQGGRPYGGSSQQGGRSYGGGGRPQGSRPGGRPQGGRPGGRPGFRPGGRPPGRGPAGAERKLLVNKEQMIEIEKLYKPMLPLPNPDVHEVIAKELDMEPRKVFFGINLIRQKMFLPKLPFPKRRLAVTVEQLNAVESLYAPLMPLPPIGCHKFIAKQLRMDEWRVHVAIGILRKQMGLPRWNPDRDDAPEEFKKQREEELAAEKAAEE